METSASAHGAGSARALVGTKALVLHPDRLLPADPAVRGIARRLYDSVASLPIVSPHGHLKVATFAVDAPISDPGTVLVGEDHYVVRLLHGRGVPLEDLLAVPGGEPRSGRTLFGHLAAHWGALGGTPSRVWLEQVLVEVLGAGTRPGPESADSLYDEICAHLAARPLTPRGLLRRFDVEMLSTTDGALANLDEHVRLGADPQFPARLVPNFRPDDVLNPVSPGFADACAKLGALTGRETGSLAGLLDALRDRRAVFAAAGSTASDHGIEISTTEHLGDVEAETLFARCRDGRGDDGDAAALTGHLLSECAAMACDDGLVMQLHIGVARDYVAEIHSRYGPDVGQDFPVATEFTRTLRPLLERYGRSAHFRLVLHTVDETTFGREIGPLASYFPSVYAGAPWWFLDAPDTMGRAFAALGETAGLSKLSGFVDDSRSLVSLGARHDVARRVFCGHLARLVAEHRLETDEAETAARAFAYETPRRLFGGTPAGGSPAG